MEAQATDGLLRFFEDLPDPRGRNKLHKLTDMLVIAILAVICGADGWEDVALFGRAKEKWLRTYLELPRGIPSHDTFGRVFARLNPDAFERCFVAWIASLMASTAGQLIAIDGKAIRRSFEHAWDKGGMAHLVSAFVGANQMVFGQYKVDDKSNEIVAIPKLLELLNVKGATVTIDAMGCQKEIAEKIVQQGGDYVLAVKDNQPTLHEKVQGLMKEARQENLDGWHGDFLEQTDGGHGRVETRKVWCVSDVQWLGPVAQDWPGLRSVAVVESTRELPGQAATTECRYYISSLEGRDAKAMASAIRGHWGIENRLHWVRDVTFDEDRSQVRKGKGPQVMATLRNLAISILRLAGAQGVARALRWCAGDHRRVLRLVGLAP
jgi:predicted transposase YbfD/YdcC